MADFDLAIIGGGINGTGIARDAAGRGLKVVVVEQGDLASGASSASSKLIDGGWCNLERGALRLVRASLREREVLLRLAPHLVRPLRFVLPFDAERRSPMRVRLGLLAYDWLGWRKSLPGTRTLDLITDPAGQPLRRHFQHAYEYSDCFADDARLVVLNAVDAAERGAIIRTRTRCVRAERAADSWRLILNARGQRDVVTARALVNAAGPWVDIVAETVVRRPLTRPLRLDRGSHILVPRLYDQGWAYVLQAADGRAVHVIPFAHDFTLIGTTEQSFVGDPTAAAPTVGEISYLCDVINDYFRATLGATDVVWAFAGVRANPETGAGKLRNVEGRHALILDRHSGAPLLTVVGGRLTTYRRLAEEVLSRLAHVFPRSRPWTARRPLPGGDFADDGAPAFLERTRHRWPFLAEDHARRLVDAYGTRIESVLQTATRPEDLGMRFGGDLTATEVTYLMRKEWAQTADDVLWRRSKLGLRFSEAQRTALEDFMAQANSRAAAGADAPPSSAGGNGTR